MKRIVNTFKATLVSRGYLDMVELLILKGADPHSRTGGAPQKTPLQLAGCGGHLAVMDELVKKGMNWKQKDDWGWTILHEVSAAGDARGIKWVSCHCSGLVNMKDKLGRTPLLTALMAGAPEDAVNELLEYGEDPGMEDDVGRSCPEAAVLYCSAAVVKLVIDACIKKNRSIEADEMGEDLIEIDKEKLLKVGEDHPEPGLLKDALNKLEH